MPATFYLIAAMLLPLISFIALLFFGRRLGRHAGPGAAVLMFGSLALSVMALIQFVSTWSDKPGVVPPYAVEAFTYRWITLAARPTSALLPPAPPALTLGILVDSLTVSLFLLVTFIAALVHLFLLSGSWGAGVGAGGGGGGDARRTARLFAFLNLLLFATLALVLANSLIQMFICWQLVGLATYFLINWQTDRRAPVMASLGVFVFNRVGDAAFLVAIGLIAFHAGAEFPNLSLFDAEGRSVLSRSVGGIIGIGAPDFITSLSTGFLGMHWLTWAGILFLVAILIRSCQFPFSWQRDLAEAPPPAAALLQSCTTLVAGVYLAARLYPILTLDARAILAIVACASLFLAALVACAQTDFRRLLAWTTTAQIGFMLLFLGTGDYTAGLLALFTHAFAKAGLLLALAAVLHVLPDPRLPRPPGLWKRLPITAGAALIAVLALAGAPFLSGAYSMNAGLSGVYAYAVALRGGSGDALAPPMLLYWLPVVATYIMAFALGRWWWLLFVNPMPRALADKAGKPGSAAAPVAPLADDVRESAIMTLPLIVLAGFCISLVFEFLRIPLFLERSLALSAHVPTQNLPAGGDVSGITETMTALAPAALGLAFLWYSVGGLLTQRLLRLPGVNLAYLYFHEGLFLQPMLELLAQTVLLLARGAAFVDRYFLGVSLRVMAFMTEALAHLLARCDTVFDRPARMAALLLAPSFRRMLPEEPPSKPAAPRE